MLLQIGQTDYTRKIIQGTYAVNQYDSYKEWLDANYKTHRNTYASKLKGTFSMYFGNQTIYQTFLSDLEAVRNVDNSVTIGLMSNNTHTWKGAAEVFIEFFPTREQRVLGDAWYPELRVDIEEK